MDSYFLLRKIDRTRLVSRKDCGPQNYLKTMLKQNRNCTHTPEQEDRIKSREPSHEAGLDLHDSL